MVAAELSLGFFVNRKAVVSAFKVDTVPQKGIS